MEAPFIGHRAGPGDVLGSRNHASVLQMAASPELALRQGQSGAGPQRRAPVSSLNQIDEFLGRLFASALRLLLGWSPRSRRATLLSPTRSRPGHPPFWAPAAAHGSARASWSSATELQNRTSGRNQFRIILRKGIQ
jgi:hypothetical protein